MTALPVSGHPSHTIFAPADHALARSLRARVLALPVEAPPPPAIPRASLMLARGFNGAVAAIVFGAGFLAGRLALALIA